MILIIDNYDSFTYNLVHSIAGDEKIIVLRNDQMRPEDSQTLNPRVLILSPGPGRPKEAGYLEDYVRFYKGKIPILGICLGHQAICEVFGANLVHAKSIMHGKQDTVSLLNDPIFDGLGSEIPAGRYHSLSIEKESLPTELEAIAYSSDGELMGVHDKRNKIYGLQFHPESIMTPDGERIIRNFLND